MPSTPNRSPHPYAGGIAASRRTFLHMSAASAAVFASGASAAQTAQPTEEISDWTTANIPPQNGRRVLVTGGNGFPQDDRSGLGYQDALALARAGADVTIASRNQERGEQAVRQIRADAPGSVVRFEMLDLADLASVKSFADRMRATGQGLDVLINNAGVMGRQKREVSVDGFERVFATNTLGHFALTAELMPLLRQGREPRVVWVTSLRIAEALPLDDLQLDRDYQYAAAYDNTKLANLMLALELDRRSKAAGWGVSSLAAHPGVVRTNLIPNGPGLDSTEGRRFRWLPFMFQPAAQGALPTLYAATSPQALAGGYYGPKGFRGLRGLPGVVPIPDHARDTQSAASLWSTLEHLARVTLV